MAILINLVQSGYSRSVNLALPVAKVKDKGFNARSFFEQQLQKCDLGPCLFVFDNFETTQNPPSAAKILKPLAGTGPIMTISVGHFHKVRRKIARLMKIKLPENCLRNSYATYGLTFRSLGDVAKAMGAAESTVKRYYTETLEPGTGKKWFKVSLGREIKNGIIDTVPKMREIDSFINEMVKYAKHEELRNRRR